VLLLASVPVATQFQITCHVDAGTVAQETSSVPPIQEATATAALEHQEELLLTPALASQTEAPPTILDNEGLLASANSPTAPGAGVAGSNTPNSAVDVAQPLYPMPYDLKATRKSSARVYLTWSASNAQAVTFVINTFQIQRKKDSESSIGPSKYKLLDVISSAHRTYTDRNANTGSTYRYKVRGCGKYQVSLQCSPYTLVAQV
jgi:hypothetical protein